MIPQACSTGFRAGDRPIDFMFEAGQGVDEVVGGGTGADTDDRAGFYIFQGRLGGHFFHVIPCHRSSPRESMPP